MPISTIATRSCLQPFPKAVLHRGSLWFFPQFCNLHLFNTATKQPRCPKHERQLKANFKKFFNKPTHINYLHLKGRSFTYFRRE